MASQLFNIGSKVVVKDKDGKDSTGNVFEYYRHLISRKVIIYLVKLDGGGSTVVWADQVTGSANK